MLRKMNPNKTEKVGDDEITIVPLAERTWLHELSMLQHLTDHATCNETLTKQPTLLFAAR